MTIERDGDNYWETETKLMTVILTNVRNENIGVLSLDVFNNDTKSGLKLGIIILMA